MGPGTIGIPRSLLFHRYGELWMSFFSALGCTTVVSPPTDLAILGRGGALAVDEACLPLKIHLGHIDALRALVDYVFVPRFVSERRGEEACTKLMALTDAVENAMPGTPIVGYTVDVRSGRLAVLGLIGLGMRLTHRPATVLRALTRAYRAQRRARNAAIREQARRLEEPGRGPRVLVVGHSYALGDSMLGAPILKYLGSLGADVISSEDADWRQAARRARTLSRDVYWTHEKELIGSIPYYRDAIDGVVFVVSFPCGPDSLVAELVQRRLRDLPLLTIVLDELRSDTALRTRLESFVDILRMRASTGTVGP